MRQSAWVWKPGPRELCDALSGENTHSYRSLSHLELLTTITITGGSLFLVTVSLFTNKHNLCFTCCVTGLRAPTATLLLRCSLRYWRQHVACDLTSPPLYRMAGHFPSTMRRAASDFPTPPCEKWFSLLPIISLSLSFPPFSSTPFWQTRLTCVLQHKLLLYCTITSHHCCRDGNQLLWPPSVRLFSPLWSPLHKEPKAKHTA